MTCWLTFIIVVSNVLSFGQCAIAELVDENKVKIYVEADIPVNVNKIRVEYEFQPTCAVYRDCDDVPTANGSGVYNISLNGISKEVFCEINSDGTKYLVIQRRMDGSVDFYKTWKEYEDGFGNIRGEFWIGNKILHQLTSQNIYKLRVELEAFDSTKAYADYRNFSIGSPETKYILNVDGYSGDAGDSLTVHNGQMFTTQDQDNDESSGNCAIIFKGAWWYKDCHASNLNGKYHVGHHESYADGVNWHSFRGHHESLKKVTMKIYK